jgi:hypothetical protein
MQRLSLIKNRLQRPAIGHFATAQKFGPKLDENNEPRFLEQVKLFY